MKTFRIVPVILLALGVAGCATAPKPEAPEGLYNVFAQAYVGFERCALLGYISPEIAAKGQQAGLKILNQYSFNSATVTDQVNKAKEFADPSKEYCLSNELSLRRTEQFTAQVQPQTHQQAPQNYMPVVPHQTHCNRVGTQTLCTTF